MSGTVDFVADDFRAQYPEFAGLCDAVLMRMWNRANLYLCNHANSPVPDLGRRRVLLYLLTAHCCALWYGQNGQQQTGGGTAAPIGGGIMSSPGRISSASEGSVSVSLDYPVTPGGEWFTQTQYGAAFWQAVRSLIGFRYRPMRIPG